MRSNSKQVVSLVALAVLFLLVSYLAHRYHDQLALIIEGGGVLGIVGFVLLTAIFVVFVIPLDIVFLIPIGAAVFGPVPTALMSIAGWTLGAAAAFWIARHFGKPVVERLIGLERIRALERRIPKRNVFWGVVLLRMLVSVDILSYALGLASEISWGSYIVATAIGVTPFGFYFAYTSTLPFWYEVLAICLALGIASLILIKYRLPREP